MEDTTDPAVHPVASSSDTDTDVQATSSGSDLSEDSSPAPVVDVTTAIEEPQFDGPTDAFEIPEDKEESPMPPPVLQMPVAGDPPPESIEFPKSITENVERILQEEIEREKATLHKHEAEVATKEAQVSEELQELEHKRQEVEHEQAEIAGAKEQLAKDWEEERKHEEQAQKAIQDLEAPTQE